MICQLYTADVGQQIEVYYEYWKAASLSRAGRHKTLQECHFSALGCLCCTMIKLMQLGSFTLFLFLCRFSGIDCDLQSNKHSAQAKGNCMIGLCFSVMLRALERLPINCGRHWIVSRVELMSLALSFPISECPSGHNNLCSECLLSCWSDWPTAMTATSYSRLFSVKIRFSHFHIWSIFFDICKQNILSAFVTLHKASCRQIWKETGILILGDRYCQ